MAQFRGLEQLVDVLELIKNPDKYTKKVEELQASVKAYQDVVESVVKLSEVNDYVNNVKQREIESKQLLANAHAEAQKLKEAVADTAKKAAEKQREKEEALGLRIAVLAEKEAILAEQEKNYVALIAKYEKLIAEQTAAIEAANKVEQDYTQLKAKLLAVVN